jgi:hypothetical protein
MNPVYSCGQGSGSGTPARHLWMLAKVEHVGGKIQPKGLHSGVHIRRHGALDGTQTEDGKEWQC